MSESCRIFPRDQSMHLQHNSMKVQKNTDYKMKKQLILSGISKEPD